MKYLTLASVILGVSMMASASQEIGVASEEGSTSFDRYYTVKAQDILGSTSDPDSMGATTRLMIGLKKECEGLAEGIKKEVQSKPGRKSGSVYALPSVDVMGISTSPINNNPDYVKREAKAICNIHVMAYN